MLAKKIAQTLEIPHVEFDAYQHGPHWTETPDEEFKEQLRQALQPGAWVADGNYSLARDIVWPRVQTLVWLDYPISVVMWRLFWRTLRRAVFRQELWNGNQDTLLRHFFSRKSLLLWAMQTHWLRRREIPSALARPEYAHIHLVHLRSPESADQWLNTLTRGQLHVSEDA